MAYQITIPFYTFKLHFSPGVHFLSPLRDKAILRSSVGLQGLAKEYEEAIQDKVLNKGAAFRLLNEWAEQDFIKDVIHVPFPASSDGVTYPNFDLEFEIYYQEMSSGFWGVVPILGVEAHATSFEHLLKNLVSTVKIEFARNNYLTSVQSIISRIWFKSAELLRAEMKLTIADPGEDLSQKELEDKTKILRKVARRLEVKKQEVYGRAEELNRVEQALRSSFSKNILLVGPSGVGKTALIWETVRQLEDRGLQGTVWETTASNMIKELSGDTGWEYNISELCRELKGLGDQFLFIRNLMDLFEVGKYVGNSVSIADYLLPFISKGEINIISECTDEELARIELASPAYTANFQVIRLEEPQKDLEGIILKKVNQLAATANVEVDEEAIKEVIRLIRRFTPYAGMPGRPIRFLESIILNKTENGNNQALKIGRTEVIEYFCEDTGMPLFMVDPSIPLFTNKIKERFNNSVFGQESAVDSLVDILATVKAALTKSGKPIASLLFVGPTGVGKTELAKVLAAFMFGRRNRMLRFDMSEYGNPYSVMRLIGQDSNSEGQLTAAVRRDPFSVILFDEIEKADNTFFDLLLQVLSEGRLTDNRGNLANFCSTIIIMTSNIGASSHSTTPIGWNQNVSNDNVKDHFVGAVRKHFRPELFNRIDRIIPFVPLDKDTVRFVVDREIKLFKQLEGIKFRKLDLEMEETVYDFLSEKGHDPKYGARHLQRAIRDRLLIPLARELNQMDYDDQILIKLAVEEEELKIKAQSDPLALELLLEELNKIQNADYASTCRKKAHQFQEGYHYTMLLQELDQLEEKKKKRKESFWTNKLDANRLGDLMQLRKRLDELSGEISDIENALALMALDLRPYRAQLLDRLEDWDKQMFQLKLDMYTDMFPSINHCNLGIYGRKCEGILHWYLPFLVEEEREFSLQTLWFKDGDLQQGVKEKGVYHLDKNPDLPSFKKEGHFKSPYPKHELVGIKLSIKGKGVYAYMSGENGTYKLLLPQEKKERLFLLTVTEGEHDIPQNIHRKDFLKRTSVTRSYNGRQFKDSHFAINREMSWTQIIPYLQEEWQDQFKANVLLEMGS